MKSHLPGLLYYSGTVRLFTIFFIFLSDRYRPIYAYKLISYSEKKKSFVKKPHCF